MFIGPRRRLKLKPKDEAKIKTYEQMNFNHELLDSKQKEYKKKTEFGIQLYRNLENVLEKRTKKSISHDNGCTGIGIANNDPQITTNIDPMIFLNQMNEEQNEFQKEQTHLGQKKPIIDGKKPFNVIKWLENKDEEMELDSEEDLQKLIKEEKQKNEEDVKEELDNEEKIEKEQKDKKKQRFRRFLKWARKKLKL